MTISIRMTMPLFRLSPLTRQDDDAAIQVVALDAAPYFEHVYRLVTEIAYHGATLYYGAVGILGGAEFDIRCFGAEEIASVASGPKK